jgi:hypothetical protein
MKAEWSERTCVCGHRPPREANPDCERCQLIAALEAAEKRATDAELRVKTAVVYLRAMVASECPSCRLDARAAIEQITRFAPSPALARRGGEGGGE